MLFTYEAFNKIGTIVNGEVDAASEKDVVLFLESKELVPSKIRQKEGRGKLSLSLNLFERVTRTDVIFLVRNIETAIRAGLSMIEALDILISDAKKGALRDILVSAKSTVQSGRPISEAFAKYGKIFPPVFIGLLKAGESSSQLDKVLGELSRHLVKEYTLVKKIKSALVYPIMLLSASFGVVIFLLAFVLPRLAKTFSASNLELPALTKVLLATSGFISGHIIIFSITTGLLIFSLVYALKTEKGKKSMMRVAFKTPVVKDLIRKIALVRFTRTLGSLLAGATPVLDALRTCSEAVGNEFYRTAVVESADKLRSGLPLSKALQFYPDLFPTLLTSLISVGEKTGNLEYVLATFSGFYDEEVENKLKDLTTLFEPLLLIIMGLIVGTVAVSVLLPIYQLVGKFT